MEKIKRFITCGVPTFACNFRCSYCYLGCHSNPYNGRIADFPISVEDMVKAFYVKRLGGICYFNMCAAGETTLQKNLFPLIKGLIDEGHYCDIITNGSISKKFDELIALLDERERSHLFLKFSFHYLQLKEKNLLETFVSNINKVKNAGISYTIEITPHDELIPYINEIKEFSLKSFGALPHITVARNEATEKIELLTKLSREEYKKTWSVFSSPLFDFKLSIFGRKINEFCYAGQNSLYVYLESGEYKSCYCGDHLGNLFKDIEKPIDFSPIGTCKLPHCFNGHAFLALAGNVPDFNMPIPTYKDERDRKIYGGGDWLAPSCQNFFSFNAGTQNPVFTDKEKKKAIRKNKQLHLFRLITGKFRALKRHLRIKK